MCRLNPTELFTLRGTDKGCAGYARCCWLEMVKPKYFTPQKAFEAQRAP
jgi:hypothetical protein